MTVNQEAKDKYGTYCMTFKGAKLSEIHDYLHDHYQGYKFAIILDEMSEEYEPLGKEIFVYFLDEILHEAAEYADVKIVKKDGKEWI